MNLKTLENGNSFEDYLVFSEVIVATSQKNTKYIQGTCFNSFGTYKFKIWDESAVNKITPNKVCYLVKGEINIFKGEFGIIIRDFVESPEVKVENLLPHVPLTEQELKDWYMNQIGSFMSQELKSLVISALNKYEDKLFTHPAAVYNHDAVVGGWMYHTLKVTYNAMSAVNLYPEANIDLVRAGALLHDIGKFEELKPVSESGFTLRGSLEGHIVIGLDILSEFKHIVDKNIYYQLRHIIASHHGELEWGSPVVPKTVEVIIVHQADLVDCRVTIAKESLNNKQLYGIEKHGVKYINPQLITEEIW